MLWQGNESGPPLLRSAADSDVCGLIKYNFNMPAGSYANLGGTCFQQIKTTKSDLRPNKLKLTITRDY